jgi:hypothetical protein
MWDGIKNAFRSAINWIIGAWNGLQFSIHIPKVHIKGTNVDVGGGELGFGVPSIPMLANGGIVNSPTLALIGEAGPEAIVPLNRGSGIGGGDTYNITVNGALDAAAVGKQLEQILLAVKRNNGKLAFI